MSGMLLCGGGYSHISSLLESIQALWKNPVCRIESGELSALGAALLANGKNEVQIKNDSLQSITPTKRNQALQDRYQRWCELRTVALQGSGLSSDPIGEICL